MSVSRGCKIIELEPGQWWCAVAFDEYDYDISDGEKFGPAPTADAAWEMKRCSNPGSHHVIPNFEIKQSDRDLLGRLYHRKDNR